MKKLKKLPPFKTDHQEENFWDKHDSTDYINWTKSHRVTFPNLKPSTQTISLRLPQDLLNKIKMLANKEDVPYQSLMKILLIRGMHALRKD